LRDGVGSIATAVAPKRTSAARRRPYGVLVGIGEEGRPEQHAVD
jgi:hypothetical protein